MLVSLFMYQKGLVTRFIFYYVIRWETAREDLNLKDWQTRYLSIMELKKKEMMMMNTDLMSSMLSRITLIVKCLCNSLPLFFLFLWMIFLCQLYDFFIIYFSESLLWLYLSPFITSSLYVKDESINTDCLKWRLSFRGWLAWTHLYNIIWEVSFLCVAFMLTFTMVDYTDTFNELKILHLNIIIVFYLVSFLKFSK